MGLRQAELGCKPMTVGSGDWLARIEVERLSGAESRRLSSALVVAAKRPSVCIALLGSPRRTTSVAAVRRLEPSDYV